MSRYNYALQPNDQRSIIHMRSCYVNEFFLHITNLQLRHHCVSTSRLHYVDHNSQISTVIFALKIGRAHV